MPRVNDTRHLPRKYTTQAEQYRVPLQNFAPNYIVTPWKIYHETEIHQQPDVQQYPDTVQAPPPPMQAFAGGRIMPAVPPGPDTSAPTGTQEDKFILQWSEDFQPGNCGMRVISTVGGYLMHFFKTTEGWQDHTSIPFRISDLWKELDKKFVLKDSVVGQVLITDRISHPAMYQLTPKLEDKITHFRASHLVQYIIARKLGTIFRGPVTRNPRYTNHIIVSWIWIPNPEWLVKSETKVFNEPKEYSGQTEALAKETEALNVLDHEQWINDNVTWPPEST